MSQAHREPYITLAGLTETSALIAWGAFFFDVSGEELDGRFKLIQDKDLKFLNPSRKTSIGESSDTYGPATLRVWRKDNTGEPIEVSIHPKPKDKINHMWVTGLTPNTTYQYSLTVNGMPWAQEERRDWVIRNGKKGMMFNKGVYDNEFTTHPPADQPTSDFTFAVIGDFGRGVRDESDEKSRQREIAEALAVAVKKENVRFILTTGDNIYDGGGSDSDWFFSYYQPYRYILNRVPVYPSCGNHDISENQSAGPEFSDDYDELVDNFYITQRFLSGDADEGAGLKDKGLFYSFNFGRDVEFISIDSAEHPATGSSAFEKTENLKFIKQAIPQVNGSATVHRIPFFHHPPFCDGPQHGNTKSVIQKLVPIFEAGGVRLVLCGHEHNFQVSHFNKIHYLLTGGAGEVRPKPLKGNEKAHNVAWSPKPHFLIVKYSSGKFEVTPYGELSNGELQKIAVTNPQGQEFPIPLMV